MSKLGNFAVIEPNERNIFGNFEAEFYQSIQTTQGHHIIGAEDRVGGMLELHELQRHFVPCGGLPISGTHEFGIERLIEGGERLLVAL